MNRDGGRGGRRRSGDGLILQSGSERWCLLDNEGGGLDGLMDGWVDDGWMYDGWMDGWVVSGWVKDG